MGLGGIGCLGPDKVKDLTWAKGVPARDHQPEPNRQWIWTDQQRQSVTTGRAGGLML
jgi:hypothetical protein